MAPWFPRTLVPWFPGSLVPLFPGSLVPWFPSSLVPWFPLSPVPLFSGSHGSFPGLLLSWFSGHWSVKEIPKPIHSVREANAFLFEERFSLAFDRHSFNENTYEFYSKWYQKRWFEELLGRLGITFSCPGGT